MRLNVTGQEVTGNDYIDPLNAGFTVTSSAPAALNTTGGTYLFFALRDIINLWKFVIVRLVKLSQSMN